MDQWISERCMYATPIRLDLLLNTNQISCCKGKWCVRRFDPDTERPYLFFCKRGGSIHILGLPRHLLWVRLRILWIPAYVFLSSIFKINYLFKNIKAGTFGKMLTWPDMQFCKDYKIIQ